MSQLRWALIGLGALFLVALALWEWRRSRRQPARTPRTEPAPADVTLISERPRRLEPDLGEMPGARNAAPDEELEVPTIQPKRPLPVARETAVDVPGAARRDAVRAEVAAASPEPEAVPEVASEPALEPVPEPVIETVAEPASAPAPAQPRAPAHEPGVASGPEPAAALRPGTAIQWPPTHSERVLTLRIIRRDGTLLPGRGLRNALEAAGLSSGPQQIFHRADPDGAVIVSAANMLQPGVLDPLQMDSTEYRGLSLFSVLPGPLPPVRMLEELVATARSVAHRLGAIVQDEHGADLDGMRLTELRRSLPAGGGAAP